MAGWKGISVDRLIAKLTGGKIGHESKSTYVTAYSLIDFDDDDLINKRALSGLAVLPTPIQVDITAGDSQPVTIPHPDMIWPSVLYRNADGSEYGGGHDSDDGADIIITGDAQDDGTFADSFTVIVKA